MFSQISECEVQSSDMWNAFYPLKHVVLWYKMFFDQEKKLLSDSSLLHQFNDM